MEKKGTKRKIPIEIRETKAQRSVTCNKRRRTIFFSKSADLCRFSGANIAVFVTSPEESSNVVYSFSGYSPASEIADCYFNGKPPPKKIDPQAKLGFLWEDPNLYRKIRNCEDLFELKIIEDRLERLKKDLIECIEKKKQPQFGTNFYQDDTNSSLDQIYGDIDEPSSSQVDHQNPNDQIYGELSSLQVDQNPSSSVEEIFQDLSSSLDESCGFKNSTDFEREQLQESNPRNTNRANGQCTLLNLFK